MENSVGGGLVGSGGVGWGEKAAAEAAAAAKLERVAALADIAVQVRRVEAFKFWGGWG